MILHIETSTNVCSVALSEGNSLLFTLADERGQNHAALLSSFIDSALATLKPQQQTLDAVAVSAGPGSYTGLRIGVSTAKGLCFGYEVPLIAIDTLQVMTVAAMEELQLTDAQTLFCPMIDARRMEVYCAMYQADGTIFNAVSAEIITENSFADLLETHKIYFFGNGAEKCKAVLTHHNAHFLDNIRPLATNMVALANQKFAAQNFADTAYFEPFYLKEFQATTPKKVKSEK
ncbi:MAG: tRNA (adenosine(37)-N6)-threonylcarbamoyltransferase complex dimerization subunit type 1 TsaB [Prevotellaceae bacterium]|jgi:tRNA threonylcarbamoyladenosine biosynthesis protein TsaB|nr:tRNA (adenosine(37)-N6)-threonylcarbamoyltransferase complex dimerization subunit type 1 TsaB [Prevotellaceae bacterium]